MALFSERGSRVAAAIPESLALAAPWIQWMARLGYLARGVVYVVVGGLAFQAAVSSVRLPEDSSGALQAILRQPLGRVLVGLVAVGLIGWVLWRLVQAFLDPEGKGTRAKGLARRAGYLTSAFLHSGLALEAVRLARGSSGGAGGTADATADHWTAVAMSQPAGRWIIAAVGAGTILFAFSQFYRAYSASFRKKLDLSRLGPDAEKRVVLVGRLGLAARGVVFGIIGWFLVRAALQTDAEEAQGFETALQTIQEQGYGQYLLAAVGVGLFAYGIFEFAEARYRVIRTQHL
jgi:hypothetical protein